MITLSIHVYVIVRVQLCSVLVSVARCNVQNDLSK